MNLSWPDMRLPNGITVSFSAVDHALLEQAEPETACIPWELDRPIGDYLIGASVRDNPDGSADVALWGAMPRAQVEAAIATGTPPVVLLPLRDFDRELLPRLRNELKMLQRGNGADGSE